jgi:hypothetical protein
VATQKGEVIEGGFQNEIEPLLDHTKDQQLYLDSLSTISALRDFSESPGDVNITLRNIGELLYQLFLLSKEGFYAFLYIPEQV